MTGSAEMSSLEGSNMSPEEERTHLAAIERLHTGLEKLHMAEAELARTRADLARSGVNLKVSDSLHW